MDEKFRVAIVLEALLWLLLFVVHMFWFVVLHVALGIGFSASVLLTLATLLTILWIVSKF